MSRIDKALQKAAQLREVASATEPSCLEAKKNSGSAVPREELGRLLQSDPLPIDHHCLITSQGGSLHAAEAYKKLKSLILKLTRSETFRNALMVTSTNMEEGKTITTLNLAMSLAREYDHTVLLVDADLRRPAIHRYLNIEPQVGLVQVLKEGASLSDALIKTGIGKLVVLPAGGTVEDPVELLASEQMKNLVEELKNRYPERYVLFDTPPALPFADAQALSASMDGLIYVVREGAISPKQLEAALEGLSGVALLGMVFNDAQFFSKKNRYNYYYYS